MTEWTPVAEEDTPGFGSRQLFVAHLGGLAEWRSVVANHSVDAIFIATEQAPDNDDVAALAEHLIRSGVFYVSCWGAGCELVHDLFDEQETWLDTLHEEQGVQASDTTVMTTWHSSESLEDALEFFWTAAMPAEGKTWGPTYLALAVGSDTFQSAVREAAAAL